MATDLGAHAESVLRLGRLPAGRALLHARGVRWGVLGRGGRVVSPARVPGARRSSPGRGGARVRRRAVSRRSGTNRGPVFTVREASPLREAGRVVICGGGRGRRRCGRVCWALGQPDARRSRQADRQDHAGPLWAVLDLWREQPRAPLQSGSSEGPTIECFAGDGGRPFGVRRAGGPGGTGSREGA